MVRAGIVASLALVTAPFTTISEDRGQIGHKYGLAMKFVNSKYCAHAVAVVMPDDGSKEVYDWLRHKPSDGLWSYGVIRFPTIYREDRFITKQVFCFSREIDAVEFKLTFG